MKIVGALLLFASTLYVGWWLSRQYYLRFKQLEAFLLFLQHIRAQIAYFQTPLASIYSGFKNEVLQKCGLLDALEQADWKEALLSIKSRLALGENEYTLLCAFGEKLGKSYKEEQLQHCAYYQEQLYAECQKIKKELPQKVKLYRSFSLMAGVMVLIVIL